VEDEMKLFAVGPYSYKNPVTFTVKRYPFMNGGWDKEEVLDWLTRALKECAHAEKRSRRKAARKSQAVRIRG
jgi:hypothetical protein